MRAAESAQEFVLAIQTNSNTSRAPLFFFLLCYFYVAVAIGEESSAAHTMRRTPKKKKRQDESAVNTNRNGLSGTLRNPVMPTPKSSKWHQIAYARAAYYVLPAQAPSKVREIPQLTQKRHGNGARASASCTFVYSLRLSQRKVPPHPPADFSSPSLLNNVCLVPPSARKTAARAKNPLRLYIILTLGWRKSDACFKRPPGARLPSSR